MSTSREVFELLDKGKSTLTTLSDINLTDWNYSLPTIQSPVNPIASRITVTETFISLFTSRYNGILSKLNYNNILIAGGSVMATLLQQNWNNDVDIFIYGLTEEEATQKVYSIIEDIYESIKEETFQKYSKEIGESATDQQIDSFIVSKISVENIRNKYCITLNLNGYSVQIILRLYKTIDQILLGFDLGSCAVGYNGNNVYFTPLGKWSYENMTNIVDPSRRSTTYEKRLVKYLFRGFRIVLPYLDIRKLRTTNLKYGLVEVCELPYFTFSYKGLVGNKITLDKALFGKSSNLCGESDYQPSDLDIHKIVYLNLKSLSQNKDNYYYYSNTLDFSIVENPDPYITEGKIIDFYDNLEQRLLKKGNVNIKMLLSYFSADYTIEIIEKAFIEKNCEYLSGIIEEQKELMVKKYRELTVNNDLVWIVKNPGTQINGSFNPIISDEKDWYGDYYLK